MDKKVVSLMCKNLKELSVDVDDMVKNDCEGAIRFIHDQYVSTKEYLDLSKAQSKS